MYFFTLCSNNYLGQACVLGKSVKRHHPDAVFSVFLMDEPSTEVDYKEFDFDVIPVRDIEPDVLSLALKYNIVELNTCIKPRVFQYLLAEKGETQVIYLDPDIKVYGYFEEVERGLTDKNILLTPHIFTPIPHDGETPQESLFLNYGIYNLGFIAVKRSEETFRFIQWWKEWTYEKGYNRTDKGIFVDQLPINFAPLFFKNVGIIESRGYNMAPWNLHERSLQMSGDRILVNNDAPLIFYHFSSFRSGSSDLPVHSYTRYRMDERPDLKQIHVQYDHELRSEGYERFKRVPCVYVQKRAAFLVQKRDNILSKKPSYKRALLALIRTKVIRNITNMICINNKSFDEYYEA